MNELYAAIPSLDGKKNYIYTTGNRAKAFANWYRQTAGFICKLGKEEVCEKKILDKPVITLSEAVAGKVNVLIPHTVWHALYDEVLSFVAPEHIYLHNDSYEHTEESCIVCGEIGILQGRGSFVPFLQERMFLRKPPSTFMVFCPNCGTCYSSYRPNDEEITRLYNGYRNDDYLKQRQKYEPAYTAEFNRSLSGEGNCAERKNGLASFLQDTINLEDVKFVLDFGGDKGQFIPDEFASAKRYVYDISGVNVLDGINRIDDFQQLSEIPWDFIMCCHVMEHLPDIQAYFRQLVSYMRIGTYLYIEVPYERLGNMDFAWIHEHINLFGRNALAKLAEQHGLNVLKTAVHSSIRCLMQRK